MFQPLGEQLRRKRESLNISIQDASTDTRIKRKYLEAIEAGNFEALPTIIQVRGFLRNYALYLKEDSDAILDQLDAAYEAQAASGGIGRFFKRQPDGQPAQSPEPAPSQPPQQQNYYQPEVVEDTPAGPLQGLRGMFQRGNGEDNQDAAQVAKNRLGRITKRLTRAPEDDYIAPYRDEGNFADDPDAPFQEIDAFNRQLEAGMFDESQPDEVAVPEVDEDPLANVYAPFSPFDPTAPDPIADNTQTDDASQSAGTGPFLKRWHKRGEQPLEPMRKPPQRPKRQPTLTQEEQPNSGGFWKRPPAQTKELPEPPAPETAPVYTPPQENKIPLRYRIRRFITIDMLVTGVFLIGTVGLILWFGLNRIPELAPELNATPQRVSAEKTPTIVPTETPQGPQTSASGEYLSVALNIDVTQMTYLRLSVDGNVEFDGQAVAGQSFNFLNVDSVALTASNARGLNIVHNEAEYLPLGGFGEIVDVLFEPNARVYGTPAALDVFPTPTPDPDAEAAPASEADAPADPAADATPDPETTPDPEAQEG